MNVKININVNKILASRGLGSSNEVRKYLASEVKRLSAPYTPFQQGNLQNTATIAADGSELVYTQPYAHYQWEGIVRGPNYTNGVIFWSGKAPKQPTGEKLTYSGGGMRGPKWTVRMFADKKEEIENNVELFIKRRG